MHLCLEVLSSKGFGKMFAFEWPFKADYRLSPVVADIPVWRSLGSRMAKVLIACVWTGYAATSFVQAHRGGIKALTLR